MIIAGLTILGLCMGSFVNALVYRLHWQETHSKQPKNKQKKYSITNGRSICPSCGHQLASKDLIPVFSWILLGGKCRYCRKPISIQYPLVELMTAALFIFSYVYWPENLSIIDNITGFIVWLVCLVGFMALIVYDLRYFILPNRIIFPLMAVALAGLSAELLMDFDIDLLVAAFWGAVIGGGLFYLLFELSKGRWIGGGDVKLGFLLGILVGGPLNALLMLFFASFLGTLYSLPMIFTRKAGTTSKIPFGPFLIIAAIIVQLFASDITDWYLNLIYSSY